MTQINLFPAVGLQARALLTATSLLLAAAPATIRAEQFVLFDVTFTYTKDDAENSKPSKSHYYVRDKQLNADRPKDWTTPVDYRNGTVHIRTEVIDKPAGSEPTTWSLCYIPNKGQKNGYGCTGTVVYKENGVYEQDVSMKSFWQNDSIAWSEGIKQMDLVIKDGSGGSGHAHKRTDHEKFFPTKVRITMVQVSAGAKYDPKLVPNLPDRKEGAKQEGAKEQPKDDTANRSVDLSPHEEPKMPGRIAFVRGNFGDRTSSKIWTMRPDGTDLKPLSDFEVTDNPGEDSPAWSPDGRRIAFSALHETTRRVFIRDADGQNEICVTPENEVAKDYEHPAWSADGKKIAFCGWPDGRESAHIYVMNADGTDKRQLTKGKDYNWLGCWSPDGRLVFESTRDGNREIYVMEADGSKPTNLSRHKATDHAPACSIPGGIVAFMCGRFENAEICVMNLDGTGLVRLTKHPARDSEPCWSGDGKWIAFTRTERGDADDLPMDIYTMKADGSEVKNVTKGRNGTDNWAPSWSPK